MTPQDRAPVLAGPAIMLISAAIFGYFGFGTTWLKTSGITGAFLFYVALLEWTLKGSAIVFAASGVLAFVRPLPANLIYSAAGLLSALGFLAVAVMDLADTQHQAMSPFLLLAFAAWNGYGSWLGLQSVLALKGNG